MFNKRCPDCRSKKITKFGHIDGKQRFRCKNCEATFYAKGDYAPVTKKRSGWFNP